MFNIKNYIFNNYCLASALIAWIISQILKTIFVYVTERRFDFGRLFGAGGMPSAHSAAVVALTFAVRRQCGTNSPIFAISAVLAAIVMYDANGVRRSSGEQAKLLNKLVDVLDIPEIKQTEIKKKLKIFNKDEPQNIKLLKEQLGHTPIEVLAGVIIGILVALFIPYY